MPIKLNGATNGSVELDVPAAVGSDLQITLPATAGEVVVKDGSGNITTTGSATFGGNVDLGNVNTSSNSNTGSKLETSGQLLLQLSSSVGAGNQNGIAVYYGNTLKTTIKNDGSATFAGNSFLLGNYTFNSSTTSGVEFDSGSFTSQRALSTGASARAHAHRFGQDITYELKNNGSATFAKVDAVFNSSVDVGLNLRNSNTGTSARFYSGSSIVGSITVTGSATAFNTSSDYRLKENVVDIADGITRVKQLSPKRFNFIVDADTTVDGFLAHEAQTVVPEAVTGEKDGEEMQGIDQSKLVPLLTAALQEAITKIETLEARVTTLEAG